jgi:hypothetical protein
MARLLVLAAALVLLGGSATVGAAGPGSPPAGTRVRITLLERVPADARPAGSSIGRLLALDADSLVLEPQNAAGTRLALHRPAIATLEVSQNRRSRAGRGALLGLIGGAVGGTVLGLGILGTQREAQGFEPIVFGLVGAFGGLGLGALVGSTVHVEDWQSVPAEGPPPAQPR